MSLGIPYLDQWHLLHSVGKWRLVICVGFNRSHNWKKCILNILYLIPRFLGQNLWNSGLSPQTIVDGVQSVEPAVTREYWTASRQLRDYLKTASMVTGLIYLSPVSSPSVQATRPVHSASHTSTAHAYCQFVSPSHHGCVLVSPSRDGCVLVSPSHDGCVLVSPSHDGCVLVSPSHDSCVLVSPSHNGCVLVSPSPDGCVLVSPSHNGCVLVSPSHDGCVLVSPSPDGCVLVSPSHNGCVLVSPSHDGCVLVSPSHDGSVLACFYQ